MGAGALALAAMVAALTPQQKAATVVVSGLPAPPGVAGVIVRAPDIGREWPADAIVFVDQEGGTVKRFRDLPPAHAASWYRKTADAFLAGRATGRALRKAGVDVDLAPVLDLPDGPLGSRHLRRPELGIAFARGLAAGGAGACVKHFPGLGSTAVNTDFQPHVDGVLRERELAGFRAAIRAGVLCVMTSHAFYEAIGRFRASLEPKTYRLLRSYGFEGVTITDSLSIVRKPPLPTWVRRAVRADVDLLLFTYAPHAQEAIRLLLPHARSGALDDNVARVLRFKRRLRSRTGSP